MDRDITKLFYSRKWKFIGALCILWGILAFSYKQHKYGVSDLNLLAGLICWGICLIFFSKEKVDDERIHMLKFRALTFGVPIGLLVTHLINYLFLNKGEPDAGNAMESISAFQSLAMILGIALAVFYYLKFKEERE